MDIFRVWILPPLVGGIIGWFTNWLAIKMLFRPLREKRLFGLRLPFTPGILPRGRARLSVSIGEIVAAELFTPDVLRARLAAPEVIAALDMATYEGLSDLARLDSGELLASATKGAGEGPLGLLAATAWRNLIAAPAFTQALEAALVEGLASIASVPLAVVLPPDKTRDFASRVLAPENAERLGARISQLIESIFAQETPGEAGRKKGLSAILPPEVLEPFVRALASGFYRLAVPGLVELLRAPSLKLELEGEARHIVHEAIERLGLVQRLFVGIAGYERRFSETMPQTVDDLVAAFSRLLREPEMPDRASEAVFAAFEEMARQPLSRAVSGIVSREAALAAAGEFIGALRDRGPELVERLAALAVSRGDATIGGLMGVLGLSSGELARGAAQSVAAFLSAPGAGTGEAGFNLSAASASFAKALVHGLRGTTLGALAGLDEEGQASLAAWLSRQALDLVSAQATRILEGIDVKAMVVERIDELEMAEIERMILAVVDRELFWITALGGILGAIIGLAQAFLATIGP
ncbi:MAG: DUF445 family protein [Treponema sp.]|nr:DUF445 family protein [Treponema sp.]